MAEAPLVLIVDDHPDARGLYAEPRRPDAAGAEGRACLRLPGTGA